MRQVRLGRKQSIAAKLAVLGTFALAIASACSLVVDTEQAQCKTTADCIKRGTGFQGLICGPQGVCVKEGGCTTNAECIDANGGKPFICNKPKRTCAPIQTTNEDDAGAGVCSYFAEDIRDDNTVWLGMLADLSGPLSQVIGLGELNGAELARSEINDKAQGIPPVSPGGPRRKIGLVYCDTVSNVDKAVRAATFLADQVGVPAVIGTDELTTTIAVASNVLVPKKVMMLAPVPSDALPVDTGNPRTLYTGFMSLNYIGKSGLGLVPLEEQVIRQKYGLAPSDPIRMALVYQDSQFNAQLIPDLVASLVINGQPAASQTQNFKQMSYVGGNEAEYIAKQNELLAFKPHIIAAIGFGEVGPKIIEPVENQWTESYRPYYILTGFSVTPELATVLNSPEQLGKLTAFRILFSNAYYRSTDVEVAAPRYNDKFSTGTPLDIDQQGFVFLTYDSMYALAYMITANGANPVTAENLVRSFPKILPPNAANILAGPRDLFNGFAALAPGAAGGINFNGLLSSWDFDLAKGGVPDSLFKMGTFCFNQDGPQFTGQFYSNGKFEGTFNCPTFATLQDAGN